MINLQPIYNEGYDVTIRFNEGGFPEIWFHGCLLPQVVSAKHGYLIVAIPGHGEPMVHSLVAFSYIGPRPVSDDATYVINHIDNNPYNANPNNLEYITQSENIRKSLNQSRRTPQQLEEWFKVWDYYNVSYIVNNIK